MVTHYSELPSSFSSKPSRCHENAAHSILNNLYAYEARLLALNTPSSRLLQDMLLFFCHQGFAKTGRNTKRICRWAQQVGNSRASEFPKAVTHSKAGFHSSCPLQQAHCSICESFLPIRGMGEHSR